MAGGKDFGTVRGCERTNRCKPENHDPNSAPAVPMVTPSSCRRSGGLPEPCFSTTARNSDFPPAFAPTSASPHPRNTRGRRFQPNAPTTRSHVVQLHPSRITAQLRRGLFHPPWIAGGGHGLRYFPRVIQKRIRGVTNGSSLTLRMIAPAG